MKKRLFVIFVLMLCFFLFSGAFCGLSTFEKRNLERTITNLPIQDIPMSKDDLANPLEEKLLDYILEDIEKNGMPIRIPGWCYADEYGVFLAYAAKRGDASLYKQIIEMNKDFFRFDPKDANANYSIIWRIEKDPKDRDVLANASGTTEMLRMIEGLWLGYKKWNNTDLRDLAYKVAKTYQRHAVEDEFGFWVHNYYSYGPKVFAQNTFLIDIDPGTLKEVAEEMNDESLKETADLSMDFIERSRGNNGIVHVAYQPEFLEVMPETNGFFSPDGYTLLFHTLLVAVVTEGYETDLRAELLNFIKEQYPKGIVLRYHVLTGEPKPIWSAQPVEWALIVRLALLENDIEFAKTIIQNELKPSIETGSLYNVGTAWFSHAANILFALREYQEKIAK